MATFRELKAQADSLLQQAEQARQAELRTVIEEIRARVEEYELTPEQIFGRKLGGARNSRNARTPAPAKYRDPKTGATWSGRGREPAWIKGKRRERYLIASES